MTSDYEQSRVSGVVWPWAQGAPPSVTPVPTWRRAALQAMVSFSAALILRYAFGRDVMAWVVAGIGGLLLLSGLLAPRFYVMLEGGLKRFGLLVGQGLTWLVLVPFYFLVFVPARFFLMLRGRDPMERRFDEQASTYWVPPVSHRDPTAFHKQY